MSTRRARLGDRWERFFDVVAAATVIVTLIALGTGQLNLASLPGAALGLLFAGGALLFLRRRFPLVAAGGAIVTSGLALLIPPIAVAVWVLAEICLFAVPLRRTRGAAITIAAIHALVLYAGALVAFDVLAWDPLALILPVWTLAVVAFGSALRSQEDYVTAVERQAAEAAAARENEVRRHIDAERLHIARDLHDSVANSITVVNLESSNARRHLLDDPERALGSLEIIRTVTRATLAELASILTVLRDNPGSNDRALATIANLPQLIETLHTEQRPITADLTAFEKLVLAPGVDAAIYRVIQEALTNATKHGTGATSISARANTETVEVEITNGVSAKATRLDPGFGLIGMRERVESAGGILRTHENQRQFTVAATLPRSTSPSEEDSR